MADVFCQIVRSEDGVLRATSSSRMVQNWPSHRKKLVLNFQLQERGNDWPVLSLCPEYPEHSLKGSGLYLASNHTGQVDSSFNLTSNMLQSMMPAATSLMLHVMRQSSLQCSRMKGL